MNLRDYETPFTVLHHHNVAKLHHAIIVGWAIKLQWTPVSVPDCLARYADADTVAYRVCVKSGSLPKSQLPSLWKSMECVLLAIDAPHAERMEASLT